MKTRMTPLHLKLLLHAYCHPEPWPHESPASREYEAQLKDADLITMDADTDGPLYWICTEKGKAHVEQLCTLPLPRQMWVNAIGEVLPIS